MFYFKGSNSGLVGDYLAMGLWRVEHHGNKNSVVEDAAQQPQEEEAENKQGNVPVTYFLQVSLLLSFRYFPIMPFKR